MATAEVVFLHPHDNICVAARLLEQGEIVRAGSQSVRLHQTVRAGHKIAMSPMREGEAVLKYGHTIGFASREIAPGEWVHDHNLQLADFARDPASASETPPPPP